MRAMLADCSTYTVDQAGVSPLGQRAGMSPTLNYAFDDQVGADGQRLVERLLNFVCRVEVVFPGEYDERNLRSRRSNLDGRHLEGGGVTHDVISLRSRAYIDTTHNVRKEIYATDIVCQALKTTPGPGGSSPTTRKSFSASPATRTRGSVTSARASESPNEP